MIPAPAAGALAPVTVAPGVSTRGLVSGFTQAAAPSGIPVSRTYRPRLGLYPYTRALAGTLTAVLQGLPTRFQRWGSTGTATGAVHACTVTLRAPALGTYSQAPLPQERELVGWSHWPLRAFQDQVSEASGQRARGAPPTRFQPAAANPLNYWEMVWAAEKFSGGCYGTYLGTGTWTFPASAAAAVLAASDPRVGRSRQGIVLPPDAVAIVTGAGVP